MCTNNMCPTLTTWISMNRNNTLFIITHKNHCYTLKQAILSLFHTPKQLVSKIPNEFSTENRKKTTPTKLFKNWKTHWKSHENIYISWKYILSLKQTAKYWSVAKSSSYNKPIYQQLLVLNCRIAWSVMWLILQLKHSIHIRRYNHKHTF